MSLRIPATLRKLALPLAVLAVSALSAPAFAQDATETPAFDPAQVAAGFAVWKKQDCIGCHGWAGNGERIGENPTGPNLRALDFDAETLKEVILCGRPGSLMPSHDPRAYSDDRCYGMTKADLGGQEILKGRDMTDAEADDLVAYMLSSMLGRPTEPTREECEAFYKGKPFCKKYPSAESQGL